MITKNRKRLGGLATILYIIGILFVGAVLLKFVKNFTYLEITGHNADAKVVRLTDGPYSYSFNEKYGSKSDHTSLIHVANDSKQVILETTRIMSIDENVRVRVSNDNKNAVLTNDTITYLKHAGVILLFAIVLYNLISTVARGRTVPAVNDN